MRQLLCPILNPFNIREKDYTVYAKNKTTNSPNFKHWTQCAKVAGENLQNVNKFWRVTAKALP